MTDEEAKALRKIEHLLASGLQTETEPIPQDNVEWDAILLRLRELPPDDLRGKLVIGGFTDKPWGPDKLSCESCMYFLAGRRWCDLPELMVPVRHGWWCRLWRI